MQTDVKIKTLQAELKKKISENDHEKSEKKFKQVIEGKLIEVKETSR